MRFISKKDSKKIGFIPILANLRSIILFKRKVNNYEKKI